MCLYMIFLYSVIYFILIKFQRLHKKRVFNIYVQNTRVLKNTYNNLLFVGTHYTRVKINSRFENVLL
jgi:hypothetical protein